MPSNRELSLWLRMPIDPSNEIALYTTTRPMTEEHIELIIEGLNLYKRAFRDSKAQLTNVEESADANRD